MYRRTDRPQPTRRSKHFPSTVDRPVENQRRNNSHPVAQIVNLRRTGQGRPELQTNNLRYWSFVLDLNLFLT